MWRATAQLSAWIRRYTDGEGAIKAIQDKIGKVKIFSLLFRHRFPVTPKSFPINLCEQFCQRPAWMLRLVRISLLF
jgi:hypothetical protein